ncbi:MAG TPA: PilC/PilY family type IV pilus protein [Burkholderiaceae bacterium]|nr:PilC/PilY family type IV pilus protein [Burkholderiaceae bacterium]
MSVLERNNVRTMEKVMIDASSYVSTARRLTAAVALSAMLHAQTAAAFTISNSPPFLPTPLPPNIIVTLDDSGSMRWAYAPDALCSTHSTRRAKSADFNPIYYNPRVRYDPPVTAAGTPLTTSFTQAWVNGFDTSRGWRDLSTNYQVTWAYDPSTTGATTDFNLCGSSATTNNFAENPAQEYNTPLTGDQRRAGVAAYYYVYEPLLTLCSPATKDNDACYTRRIVSAVSGLGTVDLNGDGLLNSLDLDERQNFANWYSFYRTRNLLTASAATKAFQTLPSDTRLGWQALNSCNASFTGSLNCKGWGMSSNVNNRISRLDRVVASPTTHKDALYSWLFRLPASGGTPLRGAMQRAGEYYRSSTASNGTNTPYAEDPQVLAGREFSCRPNFHILMTDGVWNESDGSFCSGSTCGNVDGTSRTLPDGKTYAPRAPYRDGRSALGLSPGDNSNSLADVAFHYWATDLRPGAGGLANNLIPYRVDRQGTEDQQYWNPKNDPATWQHMVNFVVGLGLRSTLNVTGAEWGGSTFAGSGYANLAAGTVAWPPTGSNTSPGNVYDLWHAAINSRGLAFNAENPTELGSALRTALNRILERESAAAALATNSTRLTTDTMLFQARFNSGDWTGKLTAYRINSDGTLGTQVWEATDSGKIPSHSARNIYTWSGTAGIGFTESELTSAGLWSHINSASLLAYLRGDASNEERNGGTYRNRSLPLGDIINSDPAYVGSENFGYASFDNSYRTFLTSKQSRRKMLYVGGNDGMLHAFDALTGEERFAYVPRAVIPNLAQLASTAYAHRYYVDGSPAAYDAHFGGGWKTVLTGTTGAGGKSVFALDVTDPDAFGTNKVLWEINDTTPYQAGDAADPQYANRLGYTIGSAAVFKANNGEWVAAFGNGYNSLSNEASLYIVRASDGRLIKRIDTLAGSSTYPNGLGSPTPYDANGDDVYDYIYATDMLGNVWKFDLSGASSTSWGVAYWNGSNPAPLFTARSPSTGNPPQPLQARVELARPPVGVSGVIVLVGTGRYFATEDRTDTTRQTFYGILDNGTRVTTTDRSQLVQQAIGTTTISLRGVNTTVRTVTTNSVDWATKRGWYMDLPSSGERVIGPAVVRAGRVIFTTVVPSDDPCEFGGTGWLMEVSATTGARLPYSVFDTNGDGLVNDADSAVTSGVPLSVGLVKQPQVMEGSPTAIKAMSGTSGNIQIERNRTFTRLGRDSWREVTR